jgi:hypothetical protein
MILKKKNGSKICFRIFFKRIPERWPYYLFITFLILMLLLKYNFKDSTSLKFKLENDETNENFQDDDEDNFGEQELDENCEIFPKYKKDNEFKVNLSDVEYPRYQYLHQNDKIDFRCLNFKSKNVKRILYWTEFFGKKDFGVGIGAKKPLERQKCPITNCEFINDKKRLNESDLVLVHMINDKIENIPKNRPNSQQWVFVLYEPPKLTTRYNYNKYNNVFNMTSTYRIDSDFPGFFQSQSDIKWREASSIRSNYNYYSGKSGFAVIIIDDYSNDRSLRMKFVNNLKKHIPIDIYGPNHNPCPLAYSNGTLEINCRKILAYEYKFFLTFENSVCKDYITDTFFDTIQYNTVPVTYGSGPYDYYVTTN